MLLRQSAKAENEARKASQKLEQEMAETLKTVHANRSEINILKDRVDSSNKIVEEVCVKNQTMEERINQIELYTSKAYYLACENRQRNCKGNFIISGRHVPRFQSGENLIFITRDLVFKKYGIDLNPCEFKVLHRLAGGRILFALHSRMAGLGFDQIVQKFNSNPNPSLEVYLSIQLIEPYSDLFYFARRLKYFKIISYYRLDENGYTYIALKENTNCILLFE